MTEQQKQEIKRLYLDGVSQYEIARRLNLTRDRIHGHIVNQPYYKPQADNLPEKIEYRADGSLVSERVLALTDKQKANPESVLRAMGIENPDAWQIQSLTLNLWHQQTKSGSRLPLYQCKVTLKPRTDGWPEMLEFIRENTAPLSIPPKPYIDRQGSLVIPLADLHFDGVTVDSDYYAETKQEIINLISRGWKHIVIAILGDLFQVNTRKGSTAHGTQLVPMKWKPAKIAAKEFIEPIMLQAVDSSSDVQVLLAMGNHSEDAEWWFVEWLQERFSKSGIKFNNEETYSKAVLLDQVFIGFNHGYRNKKNLSGNMSRKYARLWGKACHWEILTGHDHSEKTIEPGAITRTLPTRAPTDEWVDENTFPISHQAFQCFEYSETDIKGVYYV